MSPSPVLQQYQVDHPDGLAVDLNTGPGQLTTTLTMGRDFQLFENFSNYSTLPYGKHQADNSEHLTGL